LAYPTRGYLFPEDGEQADWAQIYLYDHAEALNLRINNGRTPNLDAEILAELMQMLERESFYVAGYHHMQELWEQDETGQASLRIVSSTDNDQRRYNNPQVLEPAVVFVSESGAPKPDRDIAVWPREEGKSVYRVKETSEHIDPLAYPLLFPRGEPGWHPFLQHDGVRSTTVYTRFTSAEFYGLRLMIRDWQPPDADAIEGSHLLPGLPHSAGVLFQQWVCDVYSRAEAQRLAWVTMHQDTLRADTYKGLYDAVHDPSYDQGRTPIGKKIILPASYPGSPRAMTQN